MNRKPDMNRLSSHMLLRWLAPMTLLLSGCAAMPGPSPDDPEFAPVFPEQPTPAAAQPGALYNPGTASFLFEDRRASRVGDLITVRLVENTQAQKKADTKIKKDDKTEIDPPLIFGRANPTIDGGKFGFETDIETTRDFKAESDSKQSNALTGTVTVMVTQVLPNGNLLVRGDKWVNINTGQEFVRISGIVRPQDVGPDNSVLSTRVANARIAYSGTGQMAEANSRGWLSRFFSTEWWPF